MSRAKRILVCPLDWGLGHATRCIPIIRLLIEKNAEVIIAADARPLELLRQEFPQVEFICLKGYNIRYPQEGSMILKMFFSIPKILMGIFNEHQELKKIIKEKKIDVVISDNRFGLWNKHIKSIFITHQLMIKTPIAEKLLHKINLQFINKFDECWIPDVAGKNNLSGDLTHKYEVPKNSFFIGVLSRFNKTVVKNNETTRYDVMAIVSGPEPQRSLFEKIILEQFQKSNLKAIVVCGKTEEQENKLINGSVEIVSHLKSTEMQNAIRNSKIIIARSGYSTIMDLALLGKRAVFIPTPGQTEQEYLAELFMQKKIAFYQKQSEFNLEKVLKKSGDYTGFEMIEDKNDLESRINLILFST